VMHRTLMKIRSTNMSTRSITKGSPRQCHVERLRNVTGMFEEDFEQKHSYKLSI
jgi:hypothetical protein